MGLEKTLNAIERKGIIEGKREGKQEGIIEGKEQEKREIARRLIAMGMGTSAIAAATGYTLDQVEHLQKQCHK
ncbi:hypothetical protein [Paenibacillus pinihumi]|uniref:hypothetical protein n=1 Tax=Paenibacillus pinihumi TaxID=669462 RepID=UPI0004127183|nr:hypothetical protein [Paenibacillus pinihumi]